MPKPLTIRFQQYLEFIREYIDQNRCAPTLKEIADHFNVKSSTANKALKELEKKGYLYFGNSPTLGYYIRLPEWHTSGQQMVEVSQIGLVNKYGMLYEFPNTMGHFATLRMNRRNGKLFALQMTAEIPRANLLGGDKLICEKDIPPKPEDICVMMIGPRKYFLVVILEIIPIKYKINETYYTWDPIAYDDRTHDFFMGFAREQGWILETIPESLIYGTVIRMQRDLVY